MRKLTLLFLIISGSLLGHYGDSVNQGYYNQPQGSYGPTRRYVYLHSLPYPGPQSGHYGTSHGYYNIPQDPYNDQYANPYPY